MSSFLLMILPLFSIVNCAKASPASVRNSDLLKIQDRAYQRKMSLNPERAKQVQEIKFPRKANMIFHPPLYLYNATAKLTHTQKRLGRQLDRKLTFSEHTNNTKYLICCVTVNTTRSSAFISAVNKILQDKCAAHQFHFSDNSNIKKEHFRKGGLHLPKNSIEPSLKMRSPYRLFR